MNKLTFTLSLTQQEYLRFYQGTARLVSVQANNGQQIQFPANLLRQFVTHQGINGLFEIAFDDSFKCLGLSKLD